MVGDPHTAKAEFPETQWSLFRRAAGQSEAGGTATPEAWARICGTYWLPIYAFVRRSGYSQEDAEDRTQEFFARILGTNLIERADAGQGKLRSYFLGILKKLLSEERRRSNALKRGGGAVPVSMQIGEAEMRLGGPASGSRTPAESYDYHWALVTLETATKRLRAEFAEKGKGALFEAVAPGLQGESSVSHAEAAAVLGMTESAVKVAAHRLRHRFREVLRSEVEKTLAPGSDADEELQHLRAVLQR